MKTRTVLIDAGANVGTSFSYLLKWGWDINIDLAACDFILIEPNKSCNPYLLEIEKQWKKSCPPCQVNRKVTILNKALSSKDESTILYAEEGHLEDQVDCSIIEKHNSGTHGLRVPVGETECVDISRFLKNLSENLKTYI